METRDGPRIANLYGQDFPGHGTRHEAHMRLQWMKSCLNDLASHVGPLPGPLLIAFPYRMGGGLAGGDWTSYEGEIDIFCRRICEGRDDIKVIICKTDDRRPLMSAGGRGS